MVKEDTLENLESFENTIKLIEKFQKNIREKEIRTVQIRKEKPLNLEIEIFKSSELLGKYIVKIFFG